MKMLKIKYTFFILAVIVGLQSCTKFDDGPLISLRTKEQRLANDWKIEYSINLKTGVKHSADYESWILSFDKGGSYTNTIYYGSVESTSNGSWEINGSQLKIKKSNNSETANEFYTITRLTKKELWLKDLYEEIHYYSE